MIELRLLRPTGLELPAYVEALRRGWSPDNLRPKAAAEQLEQIEADPASFLAGCDDPKAAAGPISLPDGSFVQRLPSLIRWVWDGTFCGSFGLRWQKGTSLLPEHVFGHVGFSVVPWKQGNGIAKRGLALMLCEARRVGLTSIELTTDPGNVASQAVIRACGGQDAGRFRRSAVFGGHEALRFRIDLSAPGAAPVTGRV